MSRFLSFRQKKDSYDVWRLLSSRSFAEYGESARKLQIICDIDKTYLETEFDTVMGLARIPFEKAHDKVTVAGAKEVLLALRWGDISKPLTAEKKQDYPRPLHFVSSSPPQLRNVLEEKLFLDGLDWSSDNFKDQAYNLKKRRFSMLKEQIPYKTAAILSLIEKEPQDSDFLLIGDNAERDPFIYLGVKFFIEGRLSFSAFKSYLELFSIDPEMLDNLFSRMPQNIKGSVKKIFIRDVHTYPFVLHPPLTDSIVLFSDYFDVFLWGVFLQLIEPELVEKFLQDFHNKYDSDLDEMFAKLKNFEQAGAFKGQEELLQKLCSQIEPLLSSKRKEAPSDISYLEEKTLPETESELLALLAEWVYANKKIRE